MRCFNCDSITSSCYYSPKELSKYNIFFCSKCLKLLKNMEISYFNNEEYAKKELRLKLKGNELWK